MDNKTPDDTRLEVLFDYASGLLSDDQAAEVEATLTSEERAEIESQKHVQAMLAAAPDVTLTQIERAQLRNAIKNEQPTTRPTFLARFNWATIGSVAAGLLLVVVAGTFVVNVAGGGSDTSESFDAVNAQIDETAAPSTTAAPAAGAMESADDTAMSSVDSLQAIEEPEEETAALDLANLSIFRRDDAVKLLTDPAAGPRLYNPETLECRAEIEQGDVSFGFAGQWENDDGSLTPAVVFTVEDSLSYRVLVFDVKTCDLILDESR